MFCSKMWTEVGIWQRWSSCKIAALLEYLNRPDSVYPVYLSQKFNHPCETGDMVTHVRLKRWRMESCVCKMEEQHKLLHASMHAKHVTNNLYKNLFVILRVDKF